ncbi:MAG TPA: NosD domain-containing protein, partial [Thermoanaerobaculia bacterium]
MKSWNVALSAVCLLFSFTSAYGATLVVDDDSVCAGASFTTITAALAAANNGDTIQVCDGTYAEGTIAVAKEVTIEGVNRDSTFINVIAASTFGFQVTANNVTIADLTISQVGVLSGTNGIRYQSTLTNQVVRNVRFRDFSSSSAIDISGATITDTTVTDSIFLDNRYGIRFSSTSQVDGFVLSNSSFTQTIVGAPFVRMGVYQANDGATSTLRNFEASGNTFTNHSFAGMYLEEIEDSTIDGNDFTTNNYGIYLTKIYSSNGATVNNLVVSDNDFTDHTGAAMYLLSSGAGLGPGVSFEGNRIAQSVAIPPTAPRGALITNLRSDRVHSLLTIADNSFVFTGAYQPASPSRMGIQIGGDGPIDITGNTFDGNDASTTAVPEFAAIYIHTNHSTMGLREDPINITCNDIRDFVNGIQFYNTVVGTVGGGLGAGVSIDIHSNNIVGNSLYGIYNGSTAGSSEIVDANGNWWGDPSGPSGEGPGSGDAISANVDASTFLTGPLSSCVALSITKTGAPDPVLPGEQLTYTITVTNSGGSDAAGVVVTDTISPSLTGVTTTGCAESPAGGAAICTVGALLAGTSHVITITGTVDASAPGSLSNTATVSATGVAPDAFDDSATAITAVAVQADLDILKTLVTQGEIAPGSIVTFELSVTNDGPSNATGVTVTDELP